MKRKEFMFLSSVLTPSSELPTGRSEMLASQRSEPSSMLTSETPSWRSVERKQLQPVAGLFGGAHVGLGDDLGERRAAAVEVDDARVGAVDAPAGADVDQLGGVLLEVHAMNAHLGERAAAAQGLVVLGDLVALGQVGIEVVLAVEDRAGRELGAEREADHQPEVHGARVGDGKAAGESEADRAGVRVGRVAEGQLAAAEHLRGGRELHVDLEADDRFVGGTV